MNKLDLYAPKLPFYGFQIKLETLNDYDDFNNPVRVNVYNNFEVYEYLKMLVNSYWNSDAYRVNHMLLTLFLNGSAKPILFTDNYYLGHRIKLTLFVLPRARIPKTINDILILNQYLIQLEDEFFINKNNFKLGGKISTLGE